MTTMVRGTPIAAVNQDQEQAWNGNEGAYWATHHRHLEATLDRYQPHFLAVAAISASDRVLDIGCGTGVTTQAAARAAEQGWVLGVDLSSQMISVARRLAVTEGLTNIAFAHADAQVHPFRSEDFDLVISRTGAMFFGTPDTAFANLRRSLKSRGRLVLMTWQPPHRQEWTQASARALTGHTPPPSDPVGPGPFSLSDPDRVRALLEATGFDHVEFASVREPTTYGRSVDDAQRLLLGLLGWMLENQDVRRRAESAEALREVLTNHHTADGVCFDSAAWLITARRP